MGRFKSDFGSCLEFLIAGDALQSVASFRAPSKR
jgi:hypothetical protein